MEVWGKVVEPIVDNWHAQRSVPVPQFGLDQNTWPNLKFLLLVPHAPL
jgi:hypothetical protein